VRSPLILGSSSGEILLDLKFLRGRFSLILGFSSGEIPALDFRFFSGEVLLGFLIFLRGRFSLILGFSSGEILLDFRFFSGWDSP